jgi:fructose-bisphosphate aldolase, class II
MERFLTAKAAAARLCRAHLKPAKEAMKNICKQRFQEFGCEGRASKIKVLPLSAMAKKYAAGDLDARFDETRVAAE